jgi:hypothetical protein
MGHLFSIGYHLLHILTSSTINNDNCGLNHGVQTEILPLMLRSRIASLYSRETTGKAFVLGSALFRNRNLRACREDLLLGILSTAVS